MSGNSPALPTPFLNALDARLGTGALVKAAERLSAYSRDESEFGSSGPSLLVVPSAASEIVELLRLASEYSVPVTPCGARTGKSGGSIPMHGGVALSLERMRQIHSISTEDLVARCQPGVVTGELMRQVEAKGLFYPPDPGSLDDCTLGGNVAENAGGPRALKYGVTGHYVLGLQVALPTGELLRVGKGTIKGVAGYDLTSLFVGSEGTLGVVTEVTLRLLPLPRSIATALISFGALGHAARAVSALLANGYLPRTLELLDETALRAAVADGGGFRLCPRARAALIVELDGERHEMLLEELQRISALCEGEGALETLAAQSEAQRQEIWAARRRLSSSLKKLAPFKLSEDIVVPRSQLPAMVERLHAIGRRHGLTAASYGHAGDGNLHANFLYQSEGARGSAERAVEETIVAALELGGTITGEHGVGLAKRRFLPLEQPPELLALQRRLKALFDPKGILNPGKIFLP